MKKTPLQIKIQAMNLLNEYSKTYFDTVTNYFSQFIGLDIFKVDGSIKQKYALTLPTFEGKLPDGTFFDVHAWMKNTGYVLELNVKICINGGSYDDKPSTAFCQYENASFDICEIKEGKLSPRERQPNDLTVRFNEEDILKRADRAKEAAAAYDKALSAVPYEFRDTLYLKRL